MQRLFKIPVTASLIIVNLLAFAFSWYTIGTFDEPRWTFGLLSLGAQFAPLTLDTEWYRIFTHMFLHGSIIHLLSNMYGLYVVGAGLEEILGSKKVLFVYLVCGIGASLLSIYWNLFTIGVGASGAIFGLFGFSITLNIFVSYKQKVSLLPILTNFLLFLVINIAISQAFSGDHAAHAGGLLTGALVAAYPLLSKKPLAKIGVEYTLLILFVACYFLLPRHQVTYYRFFQNVIALEDSLAEVGDNDFSDEQYLQFFKRQHTAWDSSRNMLLAHAHIPNELAPDTAILLRYIDYRIAENGYRTKMLERESYVYLDSIELRQQGIAGKVKLKYNLNFSIEEQQSVEENSSSQSEPQLPVVRVTYDEDWIETQEEPVSYYRIGTRDSLGRWQGKVFDYYANGDIQMKGTYKDNKKNGIFLYYSDHKTYTSAGRYNEDRNVGKWETYHENGTLASEIVYNNDFYVKNLWDEKGQVKVIDGNGTQRLYHPDGSIAEEGSYQNGKKEGYWYGTYQNGKKKYEENFNAGRLINGRSTDGNGKTYIYDESSYFPIPEGGFVAFNKHLRSAAGKFVDVYEGTVRVSFRVTKKKQLTDFVIEKQLNAQADSVAIAIIKSGPRWNSGKNHGFESEDAFTAVDINF